MIGMNSMFGRGAMGIGGIFGRNSRAGSSILPNYSQLNDIRLISSLSKKNNALGQLNKPTASISKDTKNFLKEYQDKMSDTMQKANALRGDNAGSKVNTLDVMSSDSSKVKATSKYRLTEPASYKVKVNKLATEQMNFTKGYSAAGNTAMGGMMDIRGSKGSTLINVGDISGKDNAEKLGNIAKAVNKESARTGVGAMVIENDSGQKQLALYGQETGSGKGFNVSGDFATGTGLDKTATEAGDAEYSVDSGSGPQVYTSSSNNVSIGGYKIEATLQGKGESTLTVGKDQSKTSGLVEDLVKSYNSTMKFLSSNTQRGTGVSRQARRMATSARSLERVGITANKDGSLVFDKNKFDAAMKKNPSLTEDIVSGSYGFANSVYQGARSGMNISSSQLTNGGSQGESRQQMNNAQLFSPLNVTGSYSRNGISDLLNYNSAGALMSINI